MEKIIEESDISLFCVILPLDLDVNASGGGC